MNSRNTDFEGAVPNVIVPLAVNSQQSATSSWPSPGLAALMVEEEILHSVCQS
jgi:hypothetical protein